MFLDKKNIKLETEEFEWFTKIIWNHSEENRVKFKTYENFLNSYKTNELNDLSIIDENLYKKLLEHLQLDYGYVGKISPKLLDRKIKIKRIKKR
jgi:hypothetical protein